MAKIITKGGPFSGHIGPVAFVKGEGNTDVTTALAYFRRHPDKYDVIETEQDENAEAERLAAEAAEAERIEAERVAAELAEAERLAALEAAEAERLAAEAADAAKAAERKPEPDAEGEKPKRTRTRKPKADKPEDDKPEGDDNQE